MPLPRVITYLTFIYNQLIYLFIDYFPIFICLLDVIVENPLAYGTIVDDSDGDEENSKSDVIDMV